MVCLHLQSSHSTAMPQTPVPSYRWGSLAAAAVAVSSAGEIATLPGVHAEASAGLAGSWQWSGWICVAPALAGNLASTQPVVAFTAKLALEAKDPTLLPRLPSAQQNYLVSLAEPPWRCTVSRLCTWNTAVFASMVTSDAGTGGLARS